MEEVLKQLIQNNLNHRYIYELLGIPDYKLSIFDETIQILSQIRTQFPKFKDSNLNHLLLLKSQIREINDYYPFRNRNVEWVIGQTDQWKTASVTDFNVHIYNFLAKKTQNLRFLSNFFQITGFLDTNIVIIGANGSGKTSLSEKLKEFLNHNGIVISAQRLLLLPQFEHISNPEITASRLKTEQRRTKTYKDANQFGYIQDEFKIVLNHLISENIAVGNHYRRTAAKKVQNSEFIENPPETNLDIVIEIWNNLIEHRYLDCEDGVNIKTYIKSTNQSYGSIQMSDGEKVLLYLICQVLLAPKDGFIVIDEPEMYLHKTILKKLWDTMESKRSDCLFIYLTHDLDFAASRNTSKKIWIKSFTYPDYWEIESIESDQIPEALLFELLGSRKNILFCEGEKGSIDETIYSLLFPEYTITPVGSCFNVINHTKAFNKLKNVHTKAFGLIDTDHHSTERLNKIRNDNIFNFSVSEVENLFLDEEFLKVFGETFLSDQSNIDLIKQDVIKELSKEQELQISNYLSAKINNIFTDTDLSKGNTLTKVKENFKSFIDEIRIDDFYDDRKKEIEHIIESKDYEKAISVFNNKGLKKIPSHHFGITDFTDKCLKLLIKMPETIEVFRKYFPKEL